LLLKNKIAWFLIGYATIILLETNGKVKIMNTKARKETIINIHRDLNATLSSYKVTILFTFIFISVHTLFSLSFSNENTFGYEIAARNLMIIAFGFFNLFICFLNAATHKENLKNNIDLLLK
tara:strand:- start:4288 stop:4653 length:366 start_codon:yes stop_codon:yes gene_type:complete